MISEQPLDVYIERQIIDEILQQCDRSVPLETIGFLIGEAFQWNKTPYCVIHGIATGKTNANEVHVEFAEGALAEVVGELRSKYADMMMVGWYHSHPGYGCFLSATDIDTQLGYFRQPYHVALVVDPIAKSYEFFKAVESELGYRRVGVATFRRKEA